MRKKESLGEGGGMLFGVLDCVRAVSVLLMQFARKIGLLLLLFTIGERERGDLGDAVCLIMIVMS